jgi:hypothetical protein
MKTLGRKLPKGKTNTSQPQRDKKVSPRNHRILQRKNSQGTKGLLEIKTKTHQTGTTQ